MKKNIHNKTTSKGIAAAASLGLEYWGPGPHVGTIWAVDKYQQAHVVRIDGKRATAWLLKNNWQAGPVATFEVSDDTQLTFKAA